MGMILSVDDDQFVLGFIGELFKSAGIPIVLTSNAIEALEIASNFSVDVAILDVSLPQMNGFELQSALRQIDPFTRVIFLSSRMNKSDLLLALRYGAVDYLTKPIDKDILLKTVCDNQQLAQQFRNRRHVS